MKIGVYVARKIEHFKPKWRHRLSFDLLASVRRRTPLSGFIPLIHTPRRTKSDLSTLVCHPNSANVHLDDIEFALDETLQSDLTLLQILFCAGGPDK